MYVSVSVCVDKCKNYGCVQCILHAVHDKQTAVRLAHAEPASTIATLFSTKRDAQHIEDCIVITCFTQDEIMLHVNLLKRM